MMRQFRDVMVGSWGTKTEQEDMCDLEEQLKPGEDVETYRIIDR